jgi:hypothetical protein
VRPDLEDKKIDAVSKRLYVNDVDMRRERHKIYKTMKDEMEHQELE